MGFGSRRAPPKTLGVEACIEMIADKGEAIVDIQ